MTRVFLLILLTLLSFESSTQAAPLKKKPFSVVIDPGHGGADFGATVQVGKFKFTEKDIALSLARLTANELQKKGIRVTLTRSQDQDLSLTERTAMANRLGADVFISIHLNSSQENPGSRSLASAEGIETYILNNSTDHSSKRLADLENAVLNGSVANNPHIHPAGDVSLIVKDLLLDANITESKELACAVQNHLVNTTSTPSTSYRNRGVKQALFYVLLGADMPSILVEAGFINNPRDRFILTAPWGQQRVAMAMATAIQDFKNKKSGSKTIASLGRCKIVEHSLSVLKAPVPRLRAQNH